MMNEQHQRIKCRIKELEIALQNIDLKRQAYENELTGWREFLDVAEAAK